MKSEDWREQAKCLLDNPNPESHDPDFFPEVHRKPEMRSRAKAKCFSCEVRSDCLEWAMAAEGDADANHRYGIAGGMDPTQRAMERRFRRTEERNRAAL